MNEGITPPDVRPAQAVRCSCCALYLVDGGLATFGLGLAALTGEKQVGLAVVILAILVSYGLKRWSESVEKNSNYVFKQ